MSTSVLSPYPFPAESRQKLEQHLELTPYYVSVSELRDLPLSQLLKRVRAIQADRLLITLDDENAKAMLPFLKVIAGLSSAQHIEIMNSEYGCTPAHRLTLIKDFLAISRASVAGRLAAVAADRELATLLKSPRIPAFIPNSNRILFINGNLWFGVKAGGSVGHIAGVINALSQSGYNVTYAAVSPNPLIEAQVKYQVLRSPLSFSFPLEYTQYLFDRSATDQILDLCSAGCGFIYQRLSLANFTGVKISRRLRVPYIVEYNGSEVWVARNWGRPLKNDALALKAEDACLRHAHVVVTISEALKEELIARGVEERRIACYPNCIDETSFDPDRFSASDRAEVRRRYQIAPDALVVGFIGTFGRWHGVDVLAYSIRKLYDEQRQWLEERKIHFLLMGDGVTMPLVRKTLGDQPSPFWTLTGLISQSEAPAHLSSADILVSPHVQNSDGSRFFGSPTKLFEYMAVGKAIVASNLEQIGDVLKNSLRAYSLPENGPQGNEGHLAILCRPGDVDELTNGIRFAADQPQWRLLLGRNARSEVLAKYTWRMHVTKILQTLEIIQDKAAPKAEI